MFYRHSCGSIRTDFRSTKSLAGVWRSSFSARSKDSDGRRRARGCSGVPDGSTGQHQCSGCPCTSSAVRLDARIESPNSEPAAIDRGHLRHSPGNFPPIPRFRKNRHDTGNGINCPGRRHMVLFCLQLVELKQLLGYLFFLKSPSVTAFNNSVWNGMDATFGDAVQRFGQKLAEKKR